MNDEERARDLVTLSDEKREWQRLLDSPQWGKLMAVVQEQVDNLQQVIVFTPLGSADGVYRQEFQKGQLEGRLSVGNTVQSIIENLDIEIERVKHA